MQEGSAYLFNLFDNELPDQRGNTLVRYRVLEYCTLFHDLGEIFNVYFRALGCGVEIARSVLELFEDAGLIDVEYLEDQEGQKIPYRGMLSIPGRRHFEIVTNLWYIICVKIGMNIYKEYILYGEDAKREASKFVFSPKIVTFYSEHGWVPESKFIEFIGHQVTLESRRIGNFEASHPEWREQISNMVGLRSDPAANIWWSYHEQLEYWNAKKSGGKA